MSHEPWPDAPPLPREVQLEITGACNLSCRMCLVRYRRKLGRHEGAMDPECVGRMLDGMPGLERLTLQGLGEPLLAPRLEEMVAAASARGVRVGFNTNGTLLTADRVRSLADAGLSWLHVSVDGARPDTYGWVRDGSDLERVGRNVRAAVEALEGSPVRPDMWLVMVAMRRNVREVPGVVSLADRWGVGRLWVQGLSHGFADTSGAPGFAEIRGFTADQMLPAEDPEARRAFARARRWARRVGVELRLPRLGDRPPDARAPGEPGCDWPWRSAYVTHRGGVQPCCMVMGEERVRLGDVASASFAEAWHGDAYREFRRRLRGDDPPEVCAGCSSYRGRF